MRPHYEWCATCDDKEKHAHGAGGARICRPELIVMSARYWRRYAKDLRLRLPKCKVCARLARALPRKV